MNPRAALAFGEPSALGSVYVINRTRFVTEDLMAVVNRVEARASQGEGGARPRLARRHLDTVPFFARLLVERIAAREGWLPAGALPGEGVTPLWIFEHHAPVPPERIEGLWSARFRVRWAVPGPGEGRFARLPASRLLLAAPEQYDENPLRRLLQVASGEQVVPGDLVADLGLRLLSLFDAWGPCPRAWVSPPVVRDLRVRVRVPVPSHGDHPCKEAA